MKQFYIKAKDNIVFICAILLTLALLCEGCAHAKVENENANIDATTQLATQLIRTVKNRDVESFMDLIPSPAAISNKESYLYDYFFGNDQSLYEYIKESQDLDYRIIMYPNREDREMRNAFDIIIYDRGKIKSLKSMSLSELRQLGRNKEIYVFFFFQPPAEYKMPNHFKGKWLMDFSGHASYFWNASEESLQEHYPIK